MPTKKSLAACPSGRRAGWAVRWFDSLVLNEVPVVTTNSTRSARSGRSTKEREHKIKSVISRGLPRLIS
jgi:hypothetical protein